MSRSRSFLVGRYFEILRPANCFPLFFSPTNKPIRYLNIFILWAAVKYPATTSKAKGKQPKMSSDGEKTKKLIYSCLLEWNMHLSLSNPQERKTRVFRLVVIGQVRFAAAAAAIDKWETSSAKWRERELKIEKDAQCWWWTNREDKGSSLSWWWWWRPCKQQSLWVRLNITLYVCRR